MKKNILTIITASILQVLVGWFLLTVIIFADSGPDRIDSILYFSLVLTPFAVALAVYLNTARKGKAVSLGVFSYFVSAFVLTFLPLIDGLYVTGVAGVGLTSLSVMSVHLVIFLLTFHVLKMIREGRKLKLNHGVVTFLCVATTCFFIGFFKTLAWHSEPYSRLALGYLDLKDLMTGIWESLFAGLLHSFLDLRILTALIVHAVFIYVVWRWKGEQTNFKKKILVVFVPIWIVIGVYSILNYQMIQRGLSDNFSNFQLTWDHQNLINDYHVELNGVPLSAWCDTELRVDDQGIRCENRYTVVSTDRLRTPPEDVYPKVLNVGLFEKVPIHSNTATECVYSDDDIQISSAFFTLKTERCDSRNFPVMARIEWDEFVLPLIACFGFDMCESERR